VNRILLCLAAAVSSLADAGVAVNPVMAQPVARVQGRVWDAATGRPLAGVLIAIRGTDARSITGQNGEFSIEVRPGRSAIHATMPGYFSSTHELDHPPGQAVTLDFTLRPISAQDQRRVFVPLPPEDSVSTESLRFSVPDSARIRHRQVLFNAFSPVVGDSLLITLFPDLTVLVPLERVTEGDGRTIARGPVTDPRTTPAGEAIFVFRGGQLTGDIRFDDRVFQILAYEGGLHVVLEIDPRKIARELPPDIPAITLDSLSFRIPFRPPLWFDPFPFLLPPFRLKAESCSDLTNLMAGPFPEIRLMVLYTQQVDDALGDIGDQIAIMIEQFNLALERSLVPQRVELALAALVPATDDAVTSVTKHRDRLQNPSDGHFDMIHEWRDAVHADAVALIVEHEAGGSGHSFIMEAVTLNHRTHAFAAVTHGAATATFTLIHEVGHIMGGQHARGSGNIFMKPYHYNHGFVIDPANVTTMAVPGTNQARRALFSNPETAYNGAPLGLPSTSTDAADNHRAFFNVSGVVSAFRLTPVWFASAGASSPWFEKRIADDLLKDVRFADFDGDGETDAFRVAANEDSWLWSRSASEPWRVLNGPDPALDMPIHQLAFGHFDGDGKADVFRSEVSTGRWLWSPGGSAGWEVLNTAPGLALPVTELGFADFDGDGLTDVFRSDHFQGAWYVSIGGATSWTLWNGPNTSLAVPVAMLAFGDFDKDGKADVFRAQPATQHWYISRGGSLAWEERNASVPEAITELAFGDFDGDGSMDAFKADGSQWWTSAGASAPWSVLGQSCHVLSALAFGDFDGDGTTDVLRNGIRP
jgi:hypothetical protein